MKDLTQKESDAGASATSAIHHMSQREEKENVQLDKPSNLFDFKFHLGIVAPPFTKGIQS
jgi:hypothetical protein